MYQQNRVTSKLLFHPLYCVVKGVGSFSIFRYLEDVIVATLARSGRYKRVFFAEYETQPCYPFYIISDISTHTPLTGNNSTLTPVSKLRSTFQSTLSSLRAIQNGQQHQPSDYFNPRSPHRERQNQTIQREIVVKFQSSLPSQGATQNIGDRGCFFQFQSTLPSQGATHYSLGALPVSVIFQSTLPSQGATQRCFFLVYIRSNFNPRSPHRERRACDGNFEVQVDISIHAPLTGSDIRSISSL